SVATDIDAKRGEAMETSIDLKTASGAATAGNSLVSSTTDTPPDGPKNYVPAIVTASIGGLALAGGVVFLVVRSGKQSDASDKLGTLEGTNPCGSGLPSKNKAACSEVADLSDQAATFGTLSLVSFGVAAGAGAATFFLWPKDHAASGFRAIRPGV